MSEDKIILTPDEAVSVLADGPYVHNYIQPAVGMFIGCDTDREDAIRIFNAATQLEIGGPSCQKIGHGLVVWTSDDRMLFFAADPQKLAALETRKLTRSTSIDQEPPQSPAA